MSQKNTAVPRLPTAPIEYDARFMDQLASILRLYFTQLNNAGPMMASSLGVGTTKVVSGLTFARPDISNPALFAISLPTDADFANLRSGDVYYDTSGGVATSYPLRIKA